MTVDTKITADQRELLDACHGGGVGSVGPTKDEVAARLSPPAAHFGLPTWPVIAYWRAAGCENWIYEETKFLAASSGEAIDDAERLFDRIEDADFNDVRVVLRDQGGVVIGSWHREDNRPTWSPGDEMRP